jgi:hypothetical protein
MKKPALPRTPPKGAMEVQSILNIKPVKEIEIDGIGMGVFSDGSTYLTGRGLARMCGIGETTLREFSDNWNAEQFKPRGIKIANALSEQGYLGKPLFIPIQVEGSTHHAYPEAVCMAFLEYYAFDAEPARDQALKNYRLLARSSLKAFIYVQIGYDPTNRIPECWKKFHDRVSLVHYHVPDGYFSIFKEMADILVSLIQGGLPVDEHTVPDGSVGIHWGNHWESNHLELRHGNRIRYEHNYPAYFPQAKSNPQHPWAYPEDALPEFRKWMREIYFKDKFPTYLENQEKRRALPPSIRSFVLAAVTGPTVKQQIDE